MKPNPDQQKELDRIFVVHTLRTSEGTRSYKVFLDKQAKTALNRYIERVVREGQFNVVQLILNTCKYEGRELYLSTTAVEQLLEDLKNNSDKHKVLTALERLAQLKSEDSA